MKNNSRISILFCLIILTTFLSCKDSNSTKNNVNEKAQLPLTENREKFYFLPKTDKGVVVKHEFYTLSYVELYEQAEWVAYELKKNRGNQNEFKRPFFIEDPKVKTGSADWRNYRRSGFDKGHLCAAADMKFSKKAFDDTFYTSNISPQEHDFNEGIWNRLEQKVRYWATKYDGIYVVTGGVLTRDLETIGDEQVAVPEYFYKVLLDESRGEYKMIGFLVPAIDSDKPLYSFTVPVDTIEKMTGIDFFPQLDDTTENKLEKNSSYKDWSF